MAKWIDRLDNRKNSINVLLVHLNTRQKIKYFLPEKQALLNLDTVIDMSDTLLFRTSFSEIANFSTEIRSPYETKSRADPSDDACLGIEFSYRTRLRLHRNRAETPVSLEYYEKHGIRKANETLNSARLRR